MLRSAWSTIGSKRSASSLDPREQFRSKPDLFRLSVINLC